MARSERASDAEFTEMRVAAVRLSDQVATLSLALQTLGHLQAKQQEMEEMARQAFIANEEQRLLSNVMIHQLTELDDTVVSREEIMSGRRRFFGEVMAVVLATVVASILLTTVLIFARVDSLNQQVSRRNCQAQVQDATALRRFLDDLVRSGTLKGGPDEVRLLQRLKEQTMVTRC